MKYYKMNIINQYKNRKIEIIGQDEANLALSNNLGNFLYLTTEKQETRYQGFFYTNVNNKKIEVYKIIDRIQFKGVQNYTEFKNAFSKIERTYDNGLTESYFLPENTNSLCLATNKNADADIILDIKHPYDARTLGRFYSVKIEEDCVVIQFTKRRDWQEDYLGDKKEFTLYLVIKTDKNIFHQNAEFINKYYPKDHQRNSGPWERFVFNALSLNFKKAVFTVNKNKKRAINEANEVFQNFDVLYKETKEYYNTLQVLSKITDPEIKMAHLCAQNSIRSLIVNREVVGAYAGLPWFFHFWHRDEAVALPQIYKINSNIAESIIHSHLDIILKGDGFPKRRFYDTLPEVQCADSIGILARACQQIFSSNNIHEDTKNGIIKKFEKIVPKLLQDRTHEDLAINYANETWMDSLNREGSRIEIQTGRMAIYKLLLTETGNDQYRIILQHTQNKVMQLFYKEGMLWDAPHDSTIRPNIFLAYYLYPELLSKQQWSECFDKILPELYLNWGGISSIAKSHPSFIDHDQGEINTAYHNGDSWYWINNLTALVLYDVNPNKYSKYINSIMEASTNEILYMGTIGHHSEISSAHTQEASGCEIQLWSSATYLDFFDRILSV